MKQTTLDLNGPIISFIQQPTSIGVCNSGIATFVGVATASFPVQTPTNPVTNTGSLSYRWYADGYGPLSDGNFLGATIEGSATTTLTVSGVTSPTLSGIRFYVGVDYVPSAYSQPVGSAVTVGTGRSTGNAINEIFNSNSATLTVFPTVSIVTQPISATSAQTRPSTFTTLGSLTDTSQGNISYRWQLNGNNLNDSSTVTGSGTTTLSISLPNIGINTVRASLSHPTSCNSPIFTNTVNFTVVSARQILNYESYRAGGRTKGVITPGIGSTNLFEGPFRNIADADSVNRSLGLYASEKDLRVRITMAGAAGVSRNGFLGGEGGVSVFEITMRQNIEYIVRVGSTTQPSGGANGGGGGTFLYEKARIIAVCGGGGGAGTTGAGGNGGGINIAGLYGSGRNSGLGGDFVQTLATEGFPAAGSIGGKVSACTWGTGWDGSGLTPCQDFISQAATDVYLLYIPNTATITRGNKPGNRGYRTNGGNGSGNDGGGGAGATGGNAATGNFGGGGGGGSGYTDGSIRLISAQSGGNTSTNGYIIIEAI